ncbi:tRNA (cytosine-5-)-methyltransferase [Sitophilus oryzae]|uniref:tRNA (Cytosine-5-)-methyltransferase n=1 Tax=Sitophilus oryzae TaxID=7048 RepID=A0A6J2Y1R5_SITOR|nr:tRNA (cytosine-5-)-methyltransferase [Sitophilus oryzae]
MNILELYSGIGGMHMAFTESGLIGEVKAAIEINNVANSIYKYNFPDTTLLNLNIEGLSENIVNKFNVNTVLMSPPCQPFTRNGNRNDVKDSRTDSFRHFLSLLPKLSKIENILIENVKGFEVSEMRSILVNVLEECDFIYQEFILSPSQFGIPNCRHRYYCLAKRKPNNFKFNRTSSLMEALPLPSSLSKEPTNIEIKDILEDELDFETYKLSDSILLKRINILDICYLDSKMTCCFTKAYGRYIEGTGSVFTSINRIDVKNKLAQLKELHNEDEYLDLARSLKLRFFTPKEISRLMQFPEKFSFPSDISNKQKYMVLGNSINVKVVSYLIKLLETYMFNLFSQNL